MTVPNNMEDRATTEKSCYEIEFPVKKMAYTHKTHEKMRS